MTRRKIAAIPAALENLILGIFIYCLFAVPAAAITDFRPGHLIVRVHDGVEPTVTSLVNDISFAEAKNLSSWKISGLIPTEKSGLARSICNDARKPLENIYILSFPDTIKVLDMARRLAGNPDVEYAEPDYRLELFSWPEDSLFDKQWYLNNTGQEFYSVERRPGNNNDILYMRTGLPGEDINMAPVYDNPAADTVPVIVGIIDTGIDFDHPDLAGNIYTNNLEIPDNGLDDDHNGYIDDYHGWDFAGDTVVIGGGSDNDPSDPVGHGTHVAGLIAAINNQIGIAGYPGKIKVMPLKIFPAIYLSAAVKALIYAADQGARVVNNSWGLSFESQALLEALQYLVSRNVLPVASMGNYGNANKVYPAAYPETFAVGATDADGHVTYFSSFGSNIDICAPGQDILSLRAAGTDLYQATEPGLRIIADKYLLADGTSMSGPIVAGAAAFLWSIDPGLDQSEVKDILRQTAHDITDPYGTGENLVGYDTISGWGRLDVGAAAATLTDPGAYFVSPAEGSFVIDTVVFRVGLTGNYSGPLDLYYGLGRNPSEWTLLHHSDTPPATDSFFTWIANGQSGYFSFRLVDEYGEDNLILRVISDERVEITWPENGSQLKHLVQISGNVYGPEYDSLQVFIRPENIPFGNVVFSGTSFYFDEKIYLWVFNNYSDGNYIIRLRAYMGARVVDDSVTVGVASLIRNGFPANVDDFAAFSPAVGDLNGDGVKEIIVGSRSGLYAFDNHGNLLDGFPVATGFDMRSMPAIDDVDGDGWLDIIAAGENIVGCYNYYGQSLPGWPKDASTGITYFTYPVPTVTQLFDKSDSVVVYMTRYGEVHAYEYSGDPYFYSLGGLFTTLDPNISDTSFFGGAWAPFVTGYDVNEDGNNEVGAIYSTALEESGFYLWDGRNGQAPLDWESPLAVMGIRTTNGGMIADLDRDGDLDVIMAGVDSGGIAKIWALDNGRYIMPGWPVELSGVADWIGTAPVCADIDGDGDREVVVAYSALDIGRVFAFNDDGTPFIENPAVSPGILLSVNAMLGNLIVADIDGDGHPNLIARGGYFFPGSGYEQIFAWEPGGGLTPGYPIITPTSPSLVGSLPYTPVFADLDNDGKAELLLSSAASEVTVWDLDVPYDSASAVWPKYLGDAKNTGIDFKTGMQLSTDPENGVIPNRFEIAKIFPNPFNPMTNISFSLDREREVRIEIFNILGQKVKTLVNDKYPAGTYLKQWNGQNDEGEPVASGIYMARLSDDSGLTSTQKMVLLK